MELETTVTLLDELTKALRIANQVGSPMAVRLEAMVMELAAEATVLVNADSRVDAFVEAALEADALADANGTPAFVLARPDGSYAACLGTALTSDQRESAPYGTFPAVRSF